MNNLEKELELKKHCRENGVSWEMLNNLLKIEKSSLTKRRRVSVKEELRSEIEKYIK